MPDRAYRLSFDCTGLAKRRPTLPVTFTYLHTTKPFDGLVESGAERSLCSVAIAIELVV
jgi:hypothetical protein